MDKKLLKKSIVANIAVLAVTVMLLVTVSFAWFSTSQESKIEQHIQIGSFVVKLNDTTETFAAASTIAVDNAYPMTRDYAISRATDAAADHLYRFEVKNSGTIGADYRFRVGFTLTWPAGETEERATALNIAQYLRFAVRHSADGVTFTDWTAAGSESSDLEALLAAVTTDSLGEQTAAGVLGMNEARQFEICVWLHEDTTIAQAPAGFGVQLSLTLQAKQHVGGAPWSIFDQVA